MKKVITYGSFDLFHEGHRRLIQRAKSLGDYLIVGVTTEHYDEVRGKINIRDPLMKRIENIQKTGLVDEIIIESSAGQKLEDVQKYQVDIFTVGSDWVGVFDYLKEYCDVIYLERTKGISSSEIRDHESSIVRLGVMGLGAMAGSFCNEAKYVSGLNVEAVFDESKALGEEFFQKQQLKGFFSQEEEFFSDIDAVYIPAELGKHYHHCKRALEAGKHVLCESPLVLETAQAQELFGLAGEKNLVLMEAIKTAYCTGFHQMIAQAKSGKIGKILDVEGCFSSEMTQKFPTKTQGAEQDLFLANGSFPLLPLVKLWGVDFQEFSWTTFLDPQGNQCYTKFHLAYPQGIAQGKVSKGATFPKHLLISGTKGHIWVDAPWWHTQSFEVCTYGGAEGEDREKFFYKFNGEGLRYELSEFVSMIINREKSNFKLRRGETLAMVEIFQRYVTGQGGKTIQLSY